MSKFGYGSPFGEFSNRFWSSRQNSATNYFWRVFPLFRQIHKCNEFQGSLRPRLFEFINIRVFQDFSSFGLFQATTCCLLFLKTVKELWLNKWYENWPNFQNSPDAKYLRIKNTKMNWILNNLFGVEIRFKFVTFFWIFTTKVSKLFSFCRFFDFAGLFQPQVPQATTCYCLFFSNWESVIGQQVIWKKTEFPKTAKILAVIYDKMFQSRWSKLILNFATYFKNCEDF